MKAAWLCLLLTVSAVADTPAQRLLEEDRPAASLRAATASFPDRVTAAEALFRLGRRREAREALARLQPQGRPAPERAEFHRVRALLEMGAHQFDLARKDLLAATQLAPGQAQRSLIALDRVWLEVAANDDARAVELLTQTLRDVGPEQARRLARVQIEVLIAQGQQDAARGLALVGLALARQQHLPGREAEFLRTLAGLEAGQGHWQQADEHSRRGVELALQWHEPEQALIGLERRQDAILGMSPTTRAKAAQLALLRAVLPRFTNLGQRARAAQMLASLLMRDRRQTEAREMHQRSLGWARQSGDRREQLRAQVAWAEFLTQVDVERREVWRAAFARALELSRQVPLAPDETGARPLHQARIHYRLACSYGPTDPEAIQHLHEAARLAWPIDRAKIGNLSLTWALKYKKLTLARECVHDVFAALTPELHPQERAESAFSLMTLLFQPDFIEQVLTGQTAFRVDEIRSTLIRELKPEHMQLLEREGLRTLARLTAYAEPAALWQAQFQHALLLDVLGRHAESLDALARSLEVARKAGFAALSSASLQYSGLVLLEEKRYLEAIRQLEQSAAMAETDIPMVAMGSYVVLGQAHRARGVPAEGVRAAERALQLQAKDARVNVHMRAWALAERAHCRLDLDQLEGALQDYREAGAVLHKVEQPWFRTLVLRREAEVLARLQHWEEAAREYAQVVEGAKGRLRFEQEVSCDYGPVLEKLGRVEEARQLYERGFAAGRELPDPTLQKKLVERGLALEVAQNQPLGAQRWLEREQALHKVRSVSDAELAGMDEHTRLAFERAQDLQEDLTHLHQEMNAGGTCADELADTRARFLLALNEVKSRNPDFESMLTVRESELVGVQEKLPDDVLVLQYYPSPEALHLLAVTRQGFQLRTVRVARTRLYELIREYRQLLAQRGNPERLREVGGLLYTLAVAPLKTELKGKRLRVIPSGLLWYLPLEALQDEEGHYLAETTEISYLSGMDLATRPPGQTAAPRVVAVGDPAELDLPGTRAELQEVGQLYPQARTLQGSAATREGLLAQANSADILHIASHSALDRQDVNGTYIQLTGEKLNLGDIYRLHLAPQSLVVLSSCESGVGEDNPGREFASLAAAFRMAGASSVVSTLWKVDDRVGPELFGEFYRQLNAGATRARALQLAKVACLKKPGLEHPGEWAAYTLLGN